MKKIVLLIFFAILSYTELSHANSNLFYPYLEFPIGSRPEAVAIGDVNADGRNDVVISTSFYFDSENDYRIHVFLQNDLGELDPPVKYSTGNWPIEPKSIDIGDVNNDGREDVVVGNYDGVNHANSYIGVFYQNNAGTLDPMVTYPTVNSNSIKIGDFNHDGLLDLVGTGASSVDVFLQNTSGTLNPPVTYTVNVDWGYEVDVGDVNNDGLTDIIVMSGRSFDYPDINFGVLTQKTDGTFNPAAYYGLGGDVSTGGLAVGDVNGDTLQDVVLTYGWNQPSSKIGIFLQNNEGTLNQAVSYDSYDSPDSVEVADVNHDGRQDIIVAHGGWYRLGVYLQDTDGTLMPEELYRIGGGDHYNPQGLAVGDINGDGLNDVVVADYNHVLVVLYHREFEPDISASPSLVNFGSVPVGGTASQTISIFNTGAANLVIGTLTFTGRNAFQFKKQNDTCSGQTLPPYYECTVDAIFSPTSTGPKKAYLSIPSNDPDTPTFNGLLYGNLQSANLFSPYVAFPTGGSPAAVAIGDINSDGRNDVVMITSSHADHSIFVFLQNASGGLDPPVQYPTGGTYTTETIDIGDMNNDGKADVVIGNYDPTDMANSYIGVFYQNDAGQLDPIVTYPTHNSYSLKIGDFNNDGLLDVTGIAWGLQTNGVYPYGDVFFQNNSGTLNPPVTYYVPHGGWDEVTAGDINGDGLTDIIVMSGQMACPEVSVLIQKADGTLDSPVYLRTYTRASYGVEVGDIDNDTLKDIVITDRYANISVFRQGNGTFKPVVSYNSYASPESVEVADVNDDGRQDIIVAHGGGDLGVYLQDTDGTLMPGELYGTLYATHFNPQGLAVGDINGDGLNDAVTANYNYGLVVLYHSPRQEPKPDIKANGSDGPLKIPPGTNLRVTVALDPGIHDGENADWWVTAKTPFGRYWYTSDRRWVRSDAPIRVHGGPLFNLAPYEVLNSAGLPLGIYKFHFGVDLLMNGSLDFAELYLDRVDVTIE